MLTLDRPISLVIRDGAPRPSVSFSERIRANYEIMTAAFSSEELLFLLVNPPELPYAEGDFIHIDMGGSYRDTRNILFNVVNNVVNRVLLEDRSASSYQDGVYIELALRKLGVENIASFMEQVRVLRAETLNTHRLTELYENNMQTLRETLLRKTEFRGKAARPAEPKDEAQGRDKALYLHSEIYRRLDTARIVHTLARFAREASEVRTRVDARELRIAEMQRAATMFALNEYRREISPFGAGDIYYNRNLYETGDILKAPTDEKAVLRQALTASLLQIIDNVTTNRAAYRTDGGDVWIDVTEALHASARDSVERFLSFRESAAAINARREPADLRTLALLTRSEGELLSRYLEDLRPRDRDDGPRAQGAPAPASAGASARGVRPGTGAARAARKRRRGAMFELARIYSARLRAAETPAQRVWERVAEESRAAPRLPEFTAQDARPETLPAHPPEGAVPLTHAPLAPAGADAGIAQDAPARQAADVAPDIPPRTESVAIADETARALARVIETPAASARTAERDTATRAETEREIIPRAPEADERETKTRESGEAGEAKAGGGADAGAPADGLLAATLSRIAWPVSLSHPTAGTETVLTESEREMLLFERETTERAAREARRADESADARRDGGRAEPQGGEAALRGALDRIDRENKERLELLKEMRTEVRETPAAVPPPRPDKRRIMRDALRAIENPTQVISEALEREAAAARAEEGAWEEPLVYADATSKRVLELLRLLQKDPVAAAAAGVTVAQGPEALIADIAAAEKERAERAAEVETTAERAALRESAERLVERNAILSEMSRGASFHPTGSAWETAAPIVHRLPPAPEVEEFSQRREQRVTEERSRRDETTETTVRMNEIRTQSEQITRDITAKSAEDIAEMVNTTLMRQIGTIADRVYGQLEKKLKNEKSRRGRM